MTIPLPESFRVCPSCGSPPRNFGSHPFVCTKCEFVYYFGPVVAVAGIISDSSGQTLLLRRAREPGKGKLGMPGGFVDAGETLEDALRREAIEEVRLNLDSIEYLTSFPNTYIYKGIGIPVTDVFFTCRVESFDALVVQMEEVDSCHICQLSQHELEQMAFPSNRKALELFLEIR